MREFKDRRCSGRKGPLLDSWHGLSARPFRRSPLPRPPPASTLQGPGSQNVGQRQPVSVAALGSDSRPCAPGSGSTASCGASTQWQCRPWPWPSPSCERPHCQLCPCRLLAPFGLRPCSAQSTTRPWRCLQAPPGWPWPRRRCRRPPVPPTRCRLPAPLQPAQAGGPQGHARGAGGDVRGLADQPVSGGAGAHRRVHQPGGQGHGGPVHAVEHLLLVRWWRVSLHLYWCRWMHHAEQPASHAAPLAAAHQAAAARARARPPPPSPPAPAGRRRC